MVIWGVLPIYWKALIPISSSVIMLYRVLMSFLTALLLAHRNYTWQEIWAPLKEDRKIIRTLAVAGVIITIIPALIIFLLCQDQIYSGMAAGAVKG